MDRSGIVLRASVWFRVLAATMLGVLPASCGRADVNERQRVDLQLFVPGVGEFTARYTCPDVAAANRELGTGPRPEFRTISFKGGSTTLVVSTPDVPDRFCVADSYVGADVSGPFNILDLRPAGNGSYWFRDHGDAKPVTAGERPLSVTVALADAEEDRDSSVSLLPGDVELTYRSGLALPVAFRPIGEPRSSGGSQAVALRELRSRLEVREGLNPLTREAVCVEFGDSLARGVERLPGDDARKALLSGLTSSCASSGSAGGHGLRAEIGNPRALSLGPAQQWIYDTGFARGEGVLLSCRIGAVPCVAGEPADVPMRMVTLVVPGLSKLKFTPDGTSALSAVYFGSPDFRDSIIFVSNTSHIFDQRGIR